MIRTFQAPTPRTGGSATFVRPKPGSTAIELSGWELDESQKCTFGFLASAVLEIDVPVSTPPSFVSARYIQRVSELYPAPTLDSDNLPVNWGPSSTTREDWGRIRILINGQDVTFLRGVPCQPESWVNAEPFGDQRAVINFPQIGPYEDIDQLFAPNSPVLIQHVDENDVVVGSKFEGMLIAYDYQGTEMDSGWRIEVLGSFYEADLLLRRPSFEAIFTDVGDHIYNTINVAIWALGLNLKYIPLSLTGFSRYARGYFEKIATGYVQELLSNVQEDSGQSWTITCENREPELVLKDRTTTHWTMRAGQRGLSLRVKRDLIDAPNVIFGEGTDDNNGHWRNTKYPLIHPDGAPIWPGNYFDTGGYTTGSDVLVWQTEMQRTGWGNDPDGVYDATDDEICRRFQASAGILVDGIVGPQTWAATFDPGANGGNVQAAHIAPLAFIPEVNGLLYSAVGGQLGLNPDYDPSIVRIERFYNYGSGVPKSLAIQSAEREIARDYTEQPDWLGSITLSADPNEGSRFDIRAGQNIKVRGFQGADILFHIAQVSVNWSNLEVTLQVDTKARDLMTLVAIKQRNEEARIDPSSRVQIGRRQSKQVEDRWPVFDSESGAGRVPLHGIQANLWNVLTIPFGAFGQIVTTDFQALAATEFAVAVFDRPITANEIAVYGSPEDADFWKDFPEQHGLLIGWGGEGEMGGYWPGRGSDGDGLTGRMVDKASWYYRSNTPPWLWVAVWSANTTYISGRFYPGSDGIAAIPILS